MAWARKRSMKFSKPIALLSYCRNQRPAQTSTQTIRRLRSSNSSTKSSAKRSSNAPPISTSSRWRTICAFAIGSMESCTKSRCRRNYACCKSTSLYCFLSSINSVQRRIITIEEPVEYRLPGVSQIDVKPEIDLTFAKGLRHILRQDPNVVMVGEIRDIETADIAIRAAMTGHLVFSTLHTNDAVGGITRLLDMDVEPFLLASVVKSFIAQRLVRTICPDCVQWVDYPHEYLVEIGFPVKELGTRFRRGSGCDQCRQTGYQGRAAIYEICLVTEPLRKLIMQKRDGGELKQCAITEGMETLRQDGWRRVAQGKTTIEEVVRVTQTDEVMAETTEEAEPVVAAKSA